MSSQVPFLPIEPVVSCPGNVGPLCSLVAAQKEQDDAVFVYKTDAALVKLPGFEVLPLGSDDAPPVFYTAAVSRLAKNPAQARAFIDFCTSAAAKPIWAKYGFETN